MKISVERVKLSLSGGRPASRRPEGMMKTAKRLAAIIGAALLALPLASCLSSCDRSEERPAKAPAAEGRLAVAVSILPEKAFVEAVGRDLVDVVCMIAPGASPETYEASPLSRAVLEKAAVYFSIGAPAEAAILEEIPPKTRLVALDRAIDEAIPPLRLGGGRDPHVWLSPRRAAVAVRRIAEELAALDPGNGAVYHANAEAYVSEVERAGAEVRKILEGREGSCFIVCHPALGYFADEFGLEMVALEEEGKEATPRHLAFVAGLARARGIKTVFYQREGSRRRAEAFAETIGGKAARLDPLAYDYTGNLRAVAEALREGAR